MAKGKVIISEELCKACSLCVHVCPVKILEISNTKMNKKGFTPVECVKPEKCIGCAFCAIMCPDSVIEVEKE